MEANPNSKGKKVPFLTEIFLDGIAPWVESSLIVQSFGMPTPTDPYCNGPYTIGKSSQMNVNGNTWTQTTDHCKWAYAEDNDYVCFGDLNRNSYAQTIRGGAFYCVNNPYLNSALKEINPKPERC